MPPTTRPRHHERRPPAAHALQGARAMLPILGGLAPLALLVGTATDQAGGSIVQGLAASWLVYSGSPQLALGQMSAAGSGLVAIVATALLLNGRLVAYSASVSTRWGSASRPGRWAAAALLVDPPYALAMADADADGRARRQRYAGSAVVLWVGWQALVVTGMAVGSHLPLDQLAFAVPLVIIAVLVPLADTPAARRGVGVAAVAAVALSALPPGTLLFAVAPVGVAAAAVGPSGWWSAPARAGSS